MDFLAPRASEKAISSPSAFFVLGGGRNRITPAANPGAHLTASGKLTGRNRRTGHAIIEVASELGDVVGDLPEAIDFHDHLAGDERIQVAGLECRLKRI